MTISNYKVVLSLWSEVNHLNYSDTYTASFFIIWCMIQWSIINRCLTQSFNLSLVGQELLTLPKHMSSPLVFSEVPVAPCLVFCIVLCRSLFILLSFFFWPLCCLSFFDLWILIYQLSLWYIQTLLKYTQVCHSIALCRFVVHLYSDT